MVTDGSVLSVHLFKRSKFVKINMYQFKDFIYSFVIR